jgi:hypothetical protein
MMRAWRQPCGCVWLHGVRELECPAHGLFLASVGAPEDRSGTFSDEECIKDNCDLDTVTADCQIKDAIIPPSCSCYHGFGVHFMSARRVSYAEP